MKNKIYVILVCAAMVAVTIFACQKNNQLTKEVVANASSISNNSISLPNKLMKSAGSCAGNCLSNVNPNCPKPCVTDVLMNGNTTQKYSIQWVSCTSNDPDNQDCNHGQSPNSFTSHVVFCYGTSTPPKNSDCVLYMELTDLLPPCIECAPTSYPQCIKMIAGCSSNNAKDYYATLTDDDPDNDIKIEYSYSLSVDDPQITVCCSRTSSTTGLKYQYCCTGWMSKLI